MLGWPIPLNVMLGWPMPLNVMLGWPILLNVIFSVPRTGPQTAVALCEKSLDSPTLTWIIFTDSTRTAQ